MDVWTGKMTDELGFLLGGAQHRKKATADECAPQTTERIEKGRSFAIFEEFPT